MAEALCVFSGGGLYFLPTNHLPLVSLQEEKYTSIFSTSVILPLCSSLSDWSISPSACALSLHCSLILLHRLSTSRSGPVCLRLSFSLSFTSLPSPPSMRYILPSPPVRPSYLPPSQNRWQTCFWNGFSLWKIPLAAQLLRVTKRSKIPGWSLDDTFLITHLTQKAPW